MDGLTLIGISSGTLISLRTWELAEAHDDSNKHSSIDRIGRRSMTGGVDEKKEGRDERIVWEETHHWHLHPNIDYRL